MVDLRETGGPSPETEARRVEERASRDQWKFIRESSKEEIVKTKPNEAYGFLVDGFAGDIATETRNVGTREETSEVKKVDGEVYGKIFKRVAVGIAMDRKNAEDGGEVEKYNKISQDSSESTYVKRMRLLVKKAKQAKRREKDEQGNDVILNNVDLQQRNQNHLERSKVISSIEDALNRVHDGVYAQEVAQKGLEVDTSSDEFRRSKMDSRKLLDSLSTY